MRDLVLGGEGLIGSALANRLRERRHEVVSLDLKSGHDLRYIDKAQIAECDRVWFLAWDTGGAKYIESVDRQHEMYKHNCELSVRLFDALAETQKPFLFTTSQLAGQPNAYGTTKLMGWHWAAHLGGRVARLWNVYGWEQPNVRSHVITDMVLSGLQGLVKCRTTGTEKRRFLYKTDCVEALIKLFDGPLATAEIAGSEWVTIKDVAGEIARQLNVEVQFGEALGSEAFIDPTEMLAGWAPRVSLAEGVSHVITEGREYLASLRGRS